MVIEYPNLDLFKNLHRFYKRDFNPFELKAGKVMQITSTKQLVPEVRFRQRFQEKYKIDQWSSCVNWDSCQMIGKAILNELLRQPFEKKRLEIEIFYHGPREIFHEEFRSTFEKFKQRFEVTCIEPSGDGHGSFILGKEISFFSTKLVFFLPFPLTGLITSLKYSTPTGTLLVEKSLIFNVFLIGGW